MQKVLQALTVFYQLNGDWCEPGREMALSDGETVDIVIPKGASHLKAIPQENANPPISVLQPQMFGGLP